MVCKYIQIFSRINYIIMRRYYNIYHDVYIDYLGNLCTIIVKHIIIIVKNTDVRWHKCDQKKVKYLYRKQS